MTPRQQRGLRLFLGDGWRFPSIEQLVYGDLSHHEGPKDTPTGKDRPARENHSTSDEQKFNVAQEPSELRTQGKLSIPARPLPHPGVDWWVERDRTQRLIYASLSPGTGSWGKACQARLSRFLLAFQ